MSLLAFCGYNKCHEEKQLEVDRVDLTGGSHSPSLEEAKIGTQTGLLGTPGARN